MANTLASPSMGFQSFRRADGGSPTQGMTEVWVASTDPGLIFRGDPVMTSSNGGTNLSGAYITSVNNNSVTTSTGFLCRGIFQGCYQYQPSVQRVVWSNFYNGSVTGSTQDIKAYIIDDPSEQFLVQASTKAAITSSYIGLNIGITYNTTTGNTLSGYSNVTLEATSALSGSSGALQPFRLVDFYSAYAPGPGAFGSVSGGASQTNIVNGIDNANVANMVIVRLNNCDRLSLTARSS
jgi:hypothetical protein